MPSSIGYCISLPRRFKSCSKFTPEVSFLLLLQCRFYILWCGAQHENVAIHIVWVYWLWYRALFWDAGILPSIYQFFVSLSNTLPIVWLLIIMLILIKIKEKRIGVNWLIHWSCTNFIISWTLKPLTIMFFCIKL